MWVSQLFIKVLNNQFARYVRSATFSQDGQEKLNTWSTELQNIWIEIDES